MRERAKAWLTLLAVGTGLLMVMGAEGGMTQGTLTEAAGIGLMLVGVVLVSLPVAAAVIREHKAIKHKEKGVDQNGRNYSIVARTHQSSKSQ